MTRYCSAAHPESTPVVPIVRMASSTSHVVDAAGRLRAAGDADDRERSAHRDEHRRHDRPDVAAQRLAGRARQHDTDERQREAAQEPATGGGHHVTRVGDRALRPATRTAPIARLRTTRSGMIRAANHAGMSEVGNPSTGPPWRVGRRGPEIITTINPPTTIQRRARLVPRRVVDQGRVVFEPCGEAGLQRQPLDAPEARHCVVATGVWTIAPITCQRISTLIQTQGRRRASVVLGRDPPSKGAPFRDRAGSPAGGDGTMTPWPPP